MNTDSEGLRSRKGKKSNHIKVKFAEKISYWRTINTLIGLGYALKNLSENFNISCIFTHLVELYFAYMRFENKFNPAARFSREGDVRSCCDLL